MHGSYTYFGTVWHKEQAAMVRQPFIAAFKPPWVNRYLSYSGSHAWISCSEVQPNQLPQAVYALQLWIRPSRAVHSIGHMTCGWADQIRASHAAGARLRPLPPRPYSLMVLRAWWQLMCVIYENSSFWSMSKDKPPTHSEFPGSRKLRNESINEWM